jgi:F-type H+-transporting ATPase subunit b
MLRQAIPALGLLTLALALGLLVRPSHSAEDPPLHQEPVANAPAEATHGGAAKSAGPDILEPQPSLAVWTVVVFVLLLLVLRALAWKPLMAALNAREENMERTLRDAEHARDESQRLLAEHRRQMAETSDQIRALIEKAHKDAEATANDILRKAQEEGEAARHRAEREIGNAKDQALIEIWNKSAELAVAVAGKVLSRELNESDHRRLVEVATTELPERPNGSTANGHGGHS